MRLELDKHNKFDSRAIAIYYKNFKLGFVPRTDNRIFYKLLSTGYYSIFDARIQQIDLAAHPEQQIRTVVHLISKK